MITCDIREITQAEYAKEARELIESMTKFAKEETKDNKNEKDEETKAWRQGAINHANGTAQIAEAYGPSISGKRYSARAMNGSVVYGLVGLMILEVQVDCVYINFLCTHPLTSQGGLLLLKHAVQVAKAHGKDGTLKLYDASRGDFYDNLGFAPLASGSSEKELKGGVFKAKKS